VPALQAGARGGVQAPPGGGARRAAAGAGRLRWAGATSGLVAFRGAEPAGWCAVEPRPAYPGLLRVYRVPWTGRSEDKADAGVWAVTCFFVRAGFRRQGVSHALARAAVGFAKGRGRGRSRGIRC
jgi:GNAT superfamily N-acetyltransferase